MQLTDDETAELTSGGSTQPRPPLANSTPPAPNPPTPPPRPASFNIPLVENSKWLDEDVEPVPVPDPPDIPKAHSTRFKPKGATAADPSPPPQAPPPEPKPRPRLINRKAATPTPPTAPPSPSTLAKQYEQRKKEESSILPNPPVARLGGTLYVDLNTKEGPDKAVAAWDYWAKTNKENPDRLTVYVYRLYPHTIPKPDTELKSDKIYGFPDYEHVPGDIGNLRTWILSKYGSGHYKFLVKDTHAGILLFAWILNGIWDWSFPPAIPPDEIDYNNPLNKTYLDGLENHGKKLQFERGESSMAFQNGAPTPNSQTPAPAPQPAYDVVSPLTETIMRLVDSRQQQAPPPSQGDAIKSISDAMAGSVTTLMGMVDRTHQMQTAATDPTAHTKQLVELAKTMIPPPVDNTALVDKILLAQAHSQDRVAAAENRVNEILTNVLTEQNKRLEREISELKNSTQHQAAAADPMAMFDKVIELKRKVEKVMGDDGAGAEADETPAKSRNGAGGTSQWMELVSMALNSPALNTLAQMGALYISNMVSKSAPAPTAPIGGFQPNPHTALPQAQQPYPPQPPAPYPGQPQAQPPTPQPQQENPAMNPLALFIGAIKQPLLTHLNNPQQDGIDFAVWLCGGYGQNTYAQIQALGREPLIQSLAAYAPDLWAVISTSNRDIPGGPPVPTPQADVFLEEFLDADAVGRALRGEVDDGDGEGDDDAAGAGESAALTPVVEPAPANPSPKPAIEVKVRTLPRT